jgi:hypothetical protein
MYRYVPVHTILPDAVQVYRIPDGDPEIAFANSFRGPLKKCTNHRPFKSAKVKTFSNFHAVARPARTAPARPAQQRRRSYELHISGTYGPAAEQPALGLRVGEAESAHRWTGTTCRAAGAMTDCRAGAMQLESSVATARSTPVRSVGFD